MLIVAGIITKTIAVIFVAGALFAALVLYVLWKVMGGDE
jgi:hypothetical protein